MVMLGAAPYSYEVAEGWGQLPDGWSFREVAAVGVDAQNYVYAFNRGAHPMVVFDRHGHFVRSWGEGVFTRAHGITMGPDGTVFCTDDGDHTVRKCTLQGKVLLTLGLPGKPAPFMSGAPFHRCTHVALDARSGEFYVSDGYGNARVHKYTPDGRLLFSWGESGTDPGQFNIVHNIATDEDGWVYVADRENHRIQVFDAQGKFETQWVNMARPSGLHIDHATGKVYVGESGAAIGANAPARGLGPRIAILDLRGQVLARLGDLPRGEGSGQFIAPHGIGLDSHGDIYVAEVAWTAYGSQLTPPREVRSLQKLVRQSV
ncbi:MAG: peptidyl-alpha-hydroxyglycine alpha-amidating lyase family protein [Candidatus Tectimicrobiota bacterium]